MALLVAIFVLSLLGLLGLLTLLLRGRASRSEPRLTTKKMSRAMRAQSDADTSSTGPAPPAGRRRRTISAAAFSEEMALEDIGEVQASDGMPPRATHTAPHPAIVAQRRQAIVLRQVFPPLAAPDSRSYYGGMPLVGPGFVWPRNTTSGQPLHFILQVDLTHGPREAGLSLLPDRGFLALYLDLAHLGSGFAIDWHDHADADLQEAPLPVDIAPAYGEDCANVWPWALSVADGTPMLPRWPFAPTAITLPDRTENSVGDHQNDAAWIDDGLTAQALANAQGGPTVLHPITVADFAEMARPWSDFPRDWLSVQIAAALLVRKARSVETDPPEWLFPGLASAERSEEVARIRTEAQAWFDHALRNGAFERLDEAVREAFWQWFTSHAALTRLIAPDVCIAAVETGLHAYPETARELPHGLIDRLAHRHTLAVHLPEGIHAIVPDRMLAPFSDVQGEHHARSDTHLLLFELSSNDGLGHHFGEGVFQFWITPQDLAARAFDKVEMTTTAY